jgi:monofunctional biosynthetic peptidoglycan transglycosylase
VRVYRWTVGAAAVMFAVLAYIWFTLPDVRPLRTTVPDTTAFMDLRADEARDAGKPVRKNQRWVSYGNISANLKRAVIVAEDGAFWSHDGIDLEEIKLAIEDSWENGEPLRGASTITQQLAKNLYLSPSRNPFRKLTELFITRRLEAELSKRRIFELYLNLIEWGDGIWGCEAAARAYFGVPASALSPEQAALMAGAIINPVRYSPAHPNRRLLNRQAIILRRMGAVTPPG